MTIRQFGELLTEFGNRQFWCGEYDIDRGSDEEYNILMEKSDIAEAAIMQHIKNLENEQTPSKGCAMTLEDKYAWLLSKLTLTSVSLWEQDGILTMPDTYFQFWKAEDLEDMDKVVELAASDWYRNSKEDT